jgi:hypothetical protein
MHTHPEYARARFLRLAYAFPRPCICYGCICLTHEERAHQRRVLRLARAVGRRFKSEPMPVNTPAG